MIAAWFLALSAFVGADFSGIWTGLMADRNGDLEDFSFRFTQTGGSVTGKMYGINESTPIAEGAATEDHITFVVTTELNGQINKTRFTGTLAGSELHMSRERTDAKPSAGKEAPGKPSPKQELILKRLG